MNCIPSQADLMAALVFTLFLVSVEAKASAATGKQESAKHLVEPAELSAKQALHRMEPAEDFVKDVVDDFRKRLSDGS